MNRRGSQPMLMPQIEHHIDKNITITNVRTSMINIVQQKEKLACVCGRIQHIPYPRARCICGKLPLKIMRAIEDEKLRRIKEIEDRAKQKRNEKEMDRQQAQLELNKLDQKPVYKSTVLRVSKQDKHHVKQYVSHQNQNQNNTRYAVQERNERIFNNKIASALHAKRIQENASKLKATHQEYLNERKTSTSAIRLRQTRWQSEPTQRKDLISRAVRGEYCGKPAQSRIKTIGDRERLLKLQAERRKKLQNIETSTNIVDVVENIMMAPEDIEKQRILTERWKNYERSMEVMRESEELKKAEERKRVEEENKIKAKLKRDRGEDLDDENDDEKGEEGGSKSEEI